MWGELRVMWTFSLIPVEILVKFMAEMQLESQDAQGVFEIHLIMEMSMGAVGSQE